MNLIIGKIDDRMRNFLKKKSFVNKSLVIDRMCNIKYIKEPICVYIPYGKILMNGLIERTYVHLEELLISTNVYRIYYYDEDNKVKLEKLQKTYGFDLVYQDF